MSKETTVPKFIIRGDDQEGSSTYSRIAGALHHAEIGGTTSVTPPLEIQPSTEPTTTAEGTPAGAETKPAYAELSPEERKGVFVDLVSGVNALVREKMAAPKDDASQEFVKAVETSRLKEVSEIRKALRGMNHPALELINEEDLFSYVSVLRNLPGNKKKVNAKLKALIETGENSAEEVAAYQRAMAARQKFVELLQADGVPIDIAIELFNNRGAAKEDKKQYVREGAPAEENTPAVEKEEQEVKSTAITEIPPAVLPAIPAEYDILPGDIEFPVENISQPSSETSEESEKQIFDCSPAVKEGFAKVGVGLDALLGLKGFESLDEGKRLLMLQNYQSAFLGRVGRDAENAVEEEWKQQPRIKQLGRMLYTLGTAKTIASHHKQREIEKNLLAGKHLTFEARQAELQALVDLAKEGPTVKVVGERAQIDYLSETEKGIQTLFPEGIDAVPEGRAILDAYNKAATKYANIPRSWFWDNVDFKEGSKRTRITQLLDEKKDSFGVGVARKFLLGKEHVSLEDARSDYYKAREDLLALLNDEGAPGSTLEKATLATNMLLASDERIRFQQEFAEHPEVEEMLQGLHDSGTVHITGKVLSEFWSKKGKYAAFGSVVRITSVAALAGLMAPAALTIAGAGIAMGAAAGNGFFRGKREAKDILRKKHASGVYSEEDLKENVVYSVDNRKRVQELEVEIEKLKNEKGSESQIQERREKIEKIQERIKEGNIIERHTKELREFRDAKFFIDRMDRLEERLEALNSDSTVNKEAIGQIERKIAQTAALMRDLHINGKINYGQENRLIRANQKTLSMLKAEYLLGDKALLENIKIEINNKIGLSQDENEKAKLLEQLNKPGADLVAERRADIEEAMDRTELQSKHLKGESHIEARILLNRFDFAKRLAFADSMVFVDKEEVEKQFSEITKNQRELLSEKEAATINRKAAKSAVVAAGFALAGYSVAQTVREWFHHDVAPGNVSSKGGGRTIVDEKMVPGRTPGAPSAVKVPGQLNPTGAPSHSVLEAGEVAAAKLAEKISLGTYEVHEGENLTLILREHVPELKNLSSHAQENVIANFLLKANPETLKSLGLADPHHIATGQHIDLDKLHSEFARLNVHGKTLVDHAKHLTDIEHTPKSGAVIHGEDQHLGVLPKTAERVEIGGTKEVVVPHEEGTPSGGAQEIVQPEVVQIPSAQSIGKIIETQATGEGQLMTYAENTAIAKTVEESIEKRINEIFGENDWFLKKIVKRTHINEWKGDPSRNLPGLRNASAHHLLNRKNTLSFGTSTEKGVKEFLAETQNETGIKPEQGERVHDYLRRALFQKEHALYDMKKIGDAPLANIPKESPIDGVFIRSEPIRAEDVPSLQNAWEAMNTHQRIVEANKLLPRLIKTDLEPSVGALKFGAVIERVRTIPAKELLSRPADLSSKYDAGSIGIVKKLSEMIQAKKLPPVGNFREKGSLFEYIEQAYRVKLMQGGPATVMTK